MIFANKEILLLLLLLIPYVVWYVMKQHKTEPTMQVSTISMYANVPVSWKVYLRHAPFVLRVLALVMLVLMLARPQSTDNWQNTEIEGIDIMLAMDISTSMLAQDLKPNRVEAAKNVSDIISSNSNPKEEMFRDAFNKVQNSDSNRDFGTTKAAKVYFSMSDVGLKRYTGSSLLCWTIELYMFFNSDFLCASDLPEDLGAYVE
mgnify:CR=1 FL=1